MASLDQVTTLFAFSEKGEEAALLALGEELLADEWDLASPPSDDEKRKRAEGWFARHGEELRKKICRDARILQHREGHGIRDEIIVAAAVIDLVATVLQGPAVCSAGATILAMGLPKWCADIWSQPTPR